MSHKSKQPQGGGSAFKSEETSKSENPVQEQVTDQQQTALQNASAYQAGRDLVVYQGLSYNEVRSVALDVFESNFFRLSGHAIKTAEQRAIEVTDKFLNRLQHEYPEGFAQAEDPGFQSALFSIQKEHARLGDDELSDLLVDLLVDRSRHPQRDIIQIVLDESLKTAPKLTKGQLAILSIVFFFKNTQNQNICNHQNLANHFDRMIKIFTENIPNSYSSLQHIAYAGCGSIDMGEISLENVLGNTYRGLFLNGFELSEVANRGIEFDLDNGLFTSCLNDPSKLQVGAINNEALDTLFHQLRVSTEDRSKIKTLFDDYKMTENEIREICIGLRPYMSALFKAWSDSPMKNLTLTSVGIAIGHANIKKIDGEFGNLAIWIN